MAEVKKKADDREAKIRQLEAKLKHQERQIVEKDKQLNEVSHKLQIAEKEIESMKTYDKLRNLEITKKQVENDLKFKKLTNEIADKEAHLMEAERYLDLKEAQKEELQRALDE